MINKKILIIIIIAIIAILVVGGTAYYFGLRQGKIRGEKTGYEKGKNDTETAYKDLIKKAETIVNPMENLPSTNPFEEVKVNPFTEIETNPFK